MRIGIAGGPRTGKTTLARSMGLELGLPVLSTDQVMDLGWSETSTEVTRWFSTPDVIIEGVALGRALRKWLAVNPQGKPLDILHVLVLPHVTLTKGQRTMGDQCITLINQVRWELRRRGVEIK